MVQWLCANNDGGNGGGSGGGGSGDGGGGGNTRHKFPPQVQYRYNTIEIHYNIIKLKYNRKSLINPHILSAKVSTLCLTC